MQLNSILECLDIELPLIFFILMKNSLILIAIILAIVSDTSAQDLIERTQQNINSRAIIPEGINVSYFSGNNILLYDGFNVAPKAHFNAAIKNCGE